MGRVIRPGISPAVKDLARHRHGKRTCASAPATPTGVSIVFHRREMGKRDRWRAKVDWNPVTLDVASRAINVERYEVQLRATDQSGDPVETNLQAEAAKADAADFTVHAGTAPATNYWRELNATPDEIKKTLTGLTTGIACQVNFYAREDLLASAPVLKFQIWNVTDGVNVGFKNETLSGLHPKLYASRTFTPAVGKTYEARISWVSGTGIGIADHIQWHDLGDVAIWRRWTSADDEPTKTVFVPIARPKTWFYQTRVRAMNRVHGARCYSAWSAWTTPVNPGHGTQIGPNAPTGLTQVIDKVEGTRRRSWRVRARWNEVPWWTPPDDDARAGVDRYIVQLGVSNDGGTTTANTRTTSIPAQDYDANQTAKKDWLHRIHGKRYYRSRVAAVAEGRRGAFSSWTAWASPGGAPGAVQNLTWSNPTPAILRAKWDDPADVSDIDRFRVRVYRQPGSVLVEDAYTYGNRFTYHIPSADRASTHRVRVNTLEEEISLDVDDVAPTGYSLGDEATQVESSDVAATAMWTSAEAPPSDGIAPTSSPTPTVVGGPGWLAVKWTAITNPDVTTYEVHLSTTTGFTPSGGTLHGQIDGTLYFIRKTIAGADLSYGTTYYVKLIAKDRDGAAAASAQGAASMAKTGTLDIAADAITANEIAAGAVTASEINVATLSAISADLGTVTAGTYKTASSGTRWEISSAVADLVRGYLSGITNPGFLSVQATKALTIQAPWESGDTNVDITMAAHATPALAEIRLDASSVGRFYVDAAEIQLGTGAQARGYCAIQAYNGHATLARSFGNGVMYGGVSTLTNVPSGITFSTVGTDQNVSSIIASDIDVRGFRFNCDIAAAAQGRVTRTFVTVGN
jgi:hypothetical protein